MLLVKSQDLQKEIVLQGRVSEIHMHKSLPIIVQSDRLEFMEIHCIWLSVFISHELLFSVI